MRLGSWCRCFPVWALTVCASETAAAWPEVFIDPVDQHLDASRWLLDRRGFLPVPLIITEPAVGYGCGVALAFFHRSAVRNENRERFVPPSISAVAAAATENGTKFAGLGHLGIWREDTLRYTGGLGAASVNLKFYGNEDFPRLDAGIEYNIEGWGTLQQLMWRWPRSDLWLGLQLIYFDAQIEVEVANAPPPLPEQLSGDVTSTGAGVAVSYDARDNIITPTRGLQLDWYARQHWGEFASDFDYLQVDGRNRWYLQLDPKWVLGVRADVSFTSGDAPFYALPSIQQRGIARARYQGAAVAATEVEARYQIDGRWFGVAFGGVGRAADAFDELDTATDRWAGGVGFRYLIARALGMQAGVDVARGPDEWAFYIQMGSGWSF